MKAIVQKSLMWRRFISDGFDRKSPTEDGKPNGVHRPHMSADTNSIPSAVPPFTQCSAYAEPVANETLEIIKKGAN